MLAFYPLILRFYTRLTHQPERFNIHLADFRQKVTVRRHFSEFPNESSFERGSAVIVCFADCVGAPPTGPRDLHGIEPRPDGVLSRWPFSRPRLPRKHTPMSQVSLDRVKWHECVIDLLSVSDVIADRDEDGRAVYYLFGWSGTVQFVDERGHLTQVPASLGSVRMDGFSLLTKAHLDTDRIVVATVRSPSGTERRVYALTRSSERAAKHGNSIDCAIVDQPDALGETAIRLTVTQDFD